MVSFDVFNFFNFFSNSEKMAKDKWQHRGISSCKSFDAGQHDAMFIWLP